MDELALGGAGIGTVPLVALALRNQPNAFVQGQEQQTDLAGQQANLSLLAGKGQLQQQQIQQNQLNMQSEQAMAEAYRNAKGDPQKTLDIARNDPRVLPDHVFAAQQHFQNLSTQYVQANEAQRKLWNDQHDALRGLMQGAFDKLSDPKTKIEDFNSDYGARLRIAQGDQLRYGDTPQQMPTGFNTMEEAQRSGDLMMAASQTWTQTRDAAEKQLQAVSRMSPEGAAAASAMGLTPNIPQVPKAGDRPLTDQEISDHNAQSQAGWQAIYAKTALPAAYQLKTGATEKDRDNARMMLNSALSRQAGKQNVTLRFEGLAQTRPGEDYLDTKGNAFNITSMQPDEFARNQKAEPGRYVKYSGQVQNTLKAQSLINDIRDGISAVSDVLNDKNFQGLSAGGRALLATAARNPEGAYNAVVGGLAASNISADSSEGKFLVNTASLLERSMSLRAIQGQGAGSDQQRTAIANMVPNLITAANPQLARLQLKSLTNNVDNLDRMVPTIGMSKKQTARQAAGSAGTTRIRASDGSLHDIPSGQLAAAKKIDPNLQVIQ